MLINFNVCVQLSTDPNRYMWKPAIIRLGITYMLIWLWCWLIFHRSYMLSTLVAMWVIPISFSAWNLWYRFIMSWIIFTALSAFIFSKVLEKPLSCTTPRLVYKWFYLLHKVSYGMGIVGYCVMMATIMGVNFIFGADPHTWMDFSIMLLFYGIYYGVLGRDLAEICSDTMALKIGKPMAKYK